MHTTPPKAFVSYSWDSTTHKGWVRDLAARLRGDGVETTLDQWHTAPGDQLPAFMERAVRENDYVLLVCTPRYKERSDGRSGGVGYEGDVMTAEVFTSGKQRKFVPILREGEWVAAAPSWVLGKRCVDLRGNPYSEGDYRELLDTLLSHPPQVPPVGRVAPAHSPIVAQQPPAGPDLEETALDHAARLQRQMASLAGCRRFLGSPEGVAAAGRAWGQLADSMKQTAEAISEHGGPLSARYGIVDGALAVAVAGHTITVKWAPQYTNTLEGTEVQMALWRGVVGGHNPVSIDQPRCLGKRRFAWARDQQGVLGLRQHSDEERFFTPEALADEAVKWLLERVERASTVKPPRTYRRGGFV